MKKEAEKKARDEAKIQKDQEKKAKEDARIQKLQEKQKAEEEEKRKKVINFDSDWFRIHDSFITGATTTIVS